MKYIAIIFSIMLLSACQKKDNTVADAAKVSITITSPTAGQVVHSNDSVAISGTVSYASELHGYEVMIVDTVTGNILYDKAEHTHTDKFVIDDKFATVVTQPTAVKLTVIATVDHNGTVAKKDVIFQLNP